MTEKHQAPTPGKLERPVASATGRWALFAYGFRPFFLGAGVAAILFIPWWAASLTWGIPLATAWPPVLWHGHEMLFGFIVAAIAGFLLTAVPSWTGSRGFAGWPLRLLAALWVLARLAVATSARLPPLFVAVTDLAFLPALAGLVLPPLLRARNRNTPLLAVLLALWVTNAVFYWGLARGNAAMARHALYFGIDVVLLLITVIGGRIVPTFTASALKHRGIEPPVRIRRGITPLAIGIMVIVAAIDLFEPGGSTAGAVALLAAAIQFVRLTQWRGLHTVRMPIVWVLHVAYLWLPVGLAMKALALLWGAALGAYYLHALTIGAATTMILAVMTRAALGHTGRPLLVAPHVAVAYILLTAAACVRVFGPLLHGATYGAIVLSAATLWAGAFGIFLWVYVPILLRPRIDGKPG